MELLPLQLQLELERNFALMEGPQTPGCRRLDWMDHSLLESLRALETDDVFTSLSLVGAADMEGPHVNMGTGGAALGSILLTNTTLEKIEILNCWLGAEGVLALARALGANQALQDLLFLGHCVDDCVVMIALAEALTINGGLKRFELKGNRVGEAGVQAFAAALRINTALESFTLVSEPTVLLPRDRELPQGLPAAALASNRLTSLTLVYFDFSVLANLAPLVELLRLPDSNLKTLNLESSSIRDEGAVELAAALESNTILTHLSLDSNPIDTAGAQAIAKALTRNVALTEIRLARTNFGADGFCALADSLTSNTTLTGLMLSSAFIPPRAQKAFIVALTSNYSIVHLIGAGVERHLCPDILSLLQRNRQSAEKLNEPDTKPARAVPFA